MRSKRMETVLRIRDLQERLARADVARERRRVEARRDDEVRAWNRLASHRTPHDMTAAELIVDRTRLAAGLDDAKNSSAAVHDARIRLGTATALWQEEAQKLDGVERLVDRQRAEERVEAERKQHAELDDLVIARWNTVDGVATPATSSLSTPHHLSVSASQSPTTSTDRPTTDGTPRAAKSTDTGSSA